MRAVEKIGASLDGVKKVKVDFADQRMTLTMKEDKSLDEATLKKAFDGSDYSVKHFKQTEVADKKDDGDKEEKKGDVTSYSASIDGMT